MIDLPTAGRRTPLVALLVLTALALLAVAEAADAKKKKKQSAAGLYVGNMINLATPDTKDPKVSFRLNPDGAVVSFTITNLPLICTTEDFNPDTDPNLRRQLETLAAPTMSLGTPLPRRGLPLGLRFVYEDPLPPSPAPGDPPPPPGSPPFRGIYVDGHVPKSGGFKGHTNVAIFNNTRGAAGTEECHFKEVHGTSYLSGSSEFDWVARKAPKRSKKKRR
jgi:hypothetical protein